MEFIRHALDGVVEIRPRLVPDSRGSFFESFRRSAFEAEGLIADFVQTNRSRSHAAGTVRGLHYQLAPSAQGKLVSVIRGAVFDVAVDLRRSSPTFGKHVAVTLTAASGAELHIPPGFAHGFCTLEPDTEVLYAVTSYYAPERERAIFWADPALGIDWPTPPDGARLSDKDLRAPMLADAADLF
ncbi:dTDP-4-dehydrorhamnose 3,5-epimerase [Hansschlegelia beijingensis]|uniref:dTDP-4-dehydrorhamnose 3,5-epimerase n=1 Tax=Hansschlegelia beijingensis TaxID=1133344 RepID=A0A7W6GGJ7_9HYPH|nr:dTDP-4-dehydrorhamnose 3,5-epimerase [Hansschlegelia beijingensis]MBB3974132.1 dTDP-4-dehydrorhamnose 3,5-epimerase [Hansschlegelia beijingensis]